MRQLLRRLNYVMRRHRLDTDLREEIEFHRAERQAAFERDGLPAEEAARASRLALGNVTLAREDARSVWVGAWFDSAAQDLRYAFRSLRRQPGFAAVMLSTLAAAIGLNASVFTVFSAFGFRPWPVPEPDRVVTIFNGSGAGNFSYPAFQHIAAHAKTLEGVFAARVAGNNNMLSGVAEAGTPSPPRGFGGASEEKVRVLWVTGDYFRVLQVEMALGRGFLASEDRLDAPGVAVVLSHAYWQRAFGRDRRIVGRNITLEDVPVTIVGVASRRFTGTTSDRVDVWLPMSAAATFRPNDGWVRDELRGGGSGAAARVAGVLALGGRLAPGVTREQGEAELAVLCAQIQPPRTPGGHGIQMRDTTILGGPKNSYYASPFPRMFGGVALVLLLACANVGNLLLARAAARQREIAVRLALGASRHRIIRQLLTESFVVAAAAGLAGVAIARYLPPAVLAAIAAQPTALRLEPDALVLAFALAVSVVACLLFGLAPALHATRSAVAGALKHEAPLPGVRFSLRSVLLSIQVAASVVLLVSAALLLRGVHRASTLDYGFAVEGVSVVSFDVPGSAYDAERTRALALQLAQELDGLADAVPIAMTQAVPFGSGNIKGSFRVPGSLEDEFNTVYEVSPRYFDVLGIPLVAGRMIRPSDASRNVVLVNESLARRFWTVEAAVGKTLVSGPRSGWNRRGELEIVGIVRDTRTPDLLHTSPTIYQPLSGRVIPLVMTRARTAGEIERISAAARRLEPRIRARAAPLADYLDQRLRGTRAAATMAGVVSVLALALASVGMFGVFAFWVQQRTHEIGVRMALGARSAQVMRTVVGSSARAIAIGLALGLGGAVAASRVIERSLFGLSALDPFAYAGVMALLAVAALTATVVPARRAMRVDPAVALRCE